jgi:hypothetical protein
MPYDIVLTYLGTLLVGATILGIVKRGRLRLCRMFVLFLVVVCLTDILPTLWPQFYTKDFWLIRESLHNVLRFLVALEIAYFAFRSFPGARSTARALLLFLLMTTLAAVLWAIWESPSLPDYSEILGKINPRQLMGIIWLLAGIAMLVLWYRLPVDRMHKAILLGWVPYLFIFTFGLERAGDRWNEIIPIANFFSVVAYFLLLTYWARAAWAPAGAHARFREPLTVPARQAS